MCRDQPDIMILTQIEAKEACNWLRTAGFPEYAQLYEDFLFPIDISLVKREHLNTLNKGAVMKLEISPHGKRSEDSDEDEPCAVSGKWTFQRDSKRWSQLEEFDVFCLKPGSPNDYHLKSAASHESMLTELSERQEVSSVRSLSSTSSVPTHVPYSRDAATPPTNSVISACSSSHFVGNDDCSAKELSSFSMKGHEKNTLSPRREPAETDGELEAQGLSPQQAQGTVQLNCVEISALNGNHINMPMVRKRSFSNSISSSQSETNSTVSTPSPVTRTRSLSTCNKRAGMYLEGFDPFSQPTFNNMMEQNFKNQESYPEDTVFYISEDHKPGTFPKALSNGSLGPSGNNSSVNWRTGSFHGPGHCSLRRENSGDSPKELKRCNSSSSMSSRLSIYDNMPGSILYSSSGDLADLENEDIFPELDDILYHVKGMEQIKFSDQGDSDSALDSVSPCPSSPKQIHLDVDHDRTTPSDLDSTGNSLNEPEECSRHRLRWHSFQRSHWPSFNSVPLQINCQSVAQMNLLQKYSLLKLTAMLEKYTPSNKHGFILLIVIMHIQQAMHYLHNHCLDQVGLFRKSGVKTQIQALCQMNESAMDCVNYEGQDLPEPLMTNSRKPFYRSYQYVPKNQRFQAIKAAIMLMPEVLQTLLYFLSDVTAVVKENQMTPTNLAMCLAPSLFHLTLKRENSSPRVMQRKLSWGKPDQKDLNENLAATQGLAHMIAECKKLNKSHLFFKEKFKSWVSYSTELSYKKVSEGPPLRLWRSTTEAPAPPEDILRCLLKEQHLWDVDLLDSKVIEILDSQTEIYQYVQNSMAPHPARDYVVLRTWRTNLPKGACALLPLDHDQAPVVGVRVNVLLSRYLIEPCGSGKADLRGHMPEWYTKSFGHLCETEVAKIRDSFCNQNTETKDTKSR
uniref:START domain-containing protein n=1 Tax=Nannospalax galili TaxID=1026970 RepID=A0A8C6S055_NANGA